MKDLNSSALHQHTPKMQNLISDFFKENDSSSYIEMLHIILADHVSTCNTEGELIYSCDLIRESTQMIGVLSTFLAKLETLSIKEGITK